jgi:putative RNA 2'-phosphotransferase
MTDELVRVSRFLSFVLRHGPDVIGLGLDEAGWVAIDELIAAAGRHGRPIRRDILDRVVAGTDKRRFEVRDGRIRAAQGHSVPIDLRLEPAEPPPVLYHGTVARSVGAILAEGLRPGARNHVHLSADAEAATAVGARRGAPVVLRIDAAGMRRHGHTFYRAANGVWLTDRVLPQWISPPRVV